MAHEEDAPIIHKPNNSPQESLEQHDEQEQKQEQEEALSLCDLPLNDTSFQEVRRSSFSDASDLFEFFNEVISDMCPAGEIFSAGKLEPLKKNPNPGDQKLAGEFFPSGKLEFLKKKANSGDQTLAGDPNIPPLATGIPKFDMNSKTRFHVSRSNSVGTFGNSPRSFRIRRSSSSVVCMERNSSTAERRSTSKSRWRTVMIGTVKPPAEMDLGDMKFRQSRRNPSARMFPAAVDGGGKSPDNRSSGKCSWILRALTCKDRRSVAVTAPLAVAQAT